MRRFIGRFLRDDSGATAIEYGLICGLIFLVIITAFTAVASKSTAMYDYINTSISGAIGGG